MFKIVDQYEDIQTLIIILKLKKTIETSIINEFIHP